MHIESAAIAVALILATVGYSAFAQSGSAVEWLLARTITEFGLSVFTPVSPLPTHYERATKTCSPIV